MRHKLIDNFRVVAAVGKKLESFTNIHYKLYFWRHLLIHKADTALLYVGVKLIMLDTIFPQW